MHPVIHTIFMTKNLAVSIATYFKLIESVDSKMDKLISKEYNSAIQMLEQVRNISNPAVYSTMLVNIIDRLNQAIQLEKNERLLLAYLGLMMCYYHLGETNALLVTQKRVAQVDFHTSFWEKYGGAIKQGGMFTLGTTLGLLGAGVGAGIGAAMGGKVGYEMKEDHEVGIRIKLEQFEKLKTALVTLRWQ